MDKSLICWLCANGCFWANAGPVVSTTRVIGGVQAGDKHQRPCNRRDKFADVLNEGHSSCDDSQFKPPLAIDEIEQCDVHAERKSREDKGRKDPRGRADCKSKAKESGSGERCRDAVALLQIQIVGHSTTLEKQDHPGDSTVEDVSSDRVT